MTTLILGMVRRALPALPISIFCGLLFYFTSRYLFAPMAIVLSTTQAFIWRTDKLITCSLLWSVLCVCMYCYINGFFCFIQINEIIQVGVLLITFNYPFQCRLSCWRFLNCAKVLLGKSSTCSLYVRRSNVIWKSLVSPVVMKMVTSWMVSTVCNKIINCPAAQSISNLKASWP